MKTRVARFGVCGFLASGALGGPGEARAQTPPTDTDAAAALVVSLAAFHDSVFGSPLDGCSVERVSGHSLRRLVDAEPGLIRHLDAVESPCEMPRHHPTQYNRGFLESMEIGPNHAELDLRGWVSDRATRWTVRFDGRGRWWRVTEAVAGGDLYSHGGENRPPEGIPERLLEALRDRWGPELRLDSRLALWKPESGFFSVVDLDVAEPDTRRATLGTDELPGRFLERAACWAASHALDAPPLRDLRLDPEDCIEGSSTEVMLGGTRARPPNRWLHHVWAVTADRLEVLEAEFSWEGALVGLRTIAELHRAEAPALSPSTGNPP